MCQNWKTQVGVLITICILETNNKPRFIAEININKKTNYLEGLDLEEEVHVTCCPYHLHLQMA